MSILNIFAQDAFSVMRLTDALREISYAPSFVGQMGIFQTISIDTLDIAIEKDKARNRLLIQASPRGGPGQTFGRSQRSMRMLKIPHFQVDDAIYADEVQQARMFGDEVAVERLQQKIADRAAEVSVIVRDAEVNGKCLTYHADRDQPAEKAAANVGLATLGVIVR